MQRDKLNSSITILTCLLLLGVFFPSHAFAGFLWKDDTGRIIDPPFQVKAKWVWLSLSVRELKRPAYRLRIDFPLDLHVKVLQKTAVRGDVLQLPQVPSHTALVAYTMSRQSQIFFETLDIKTRKKSRMSLEISLIPQETMLWNDQSCTREGVKLTKKNIASTEPFLYLASVCRKQGKKLNVTLLWSADANSGNISLAGLTGQKIASYSPAIVPQEASGLSKDKMTSAWVTFNLDFFDEKQNQELNGIRAPASLGNLAIGKNNETEQSDHPELSPSEHSDESAFSIDWMPRRVRPSWDWNAGISLANYDYSETLSSVKIQQTSLVGSVGVHHWLSVDNWDFQSRARMSLLSLRSQVSSNDTKAPSDPRFYEVEAMYGYLLPRSLSGENFPRLKFLMGAQVWGMIVPHDNYGVKLLLGPQLGLEFSDETGAARKLWNGYIIVAPVSDHTITFQLHSYKLNLGGSYELTSPMATHPISAVSDLEWVSMTLSDSDNSFQAFTFNLGLRMGF